MTKNQRNILIGVAVLLLLYFYFTSSQQEKKSGDENGNGNGNGGQTPPTPQNCTNTCCSALGNLISPSSFPKCECPQSDYVFDNGQCTLVGVVGCMDTTATNFNPIATIPDAQSCQYGQQNRDCFTNCRSGGTYNTINTPDACGTGSATGYPLTTAPFCTPSVVVPSIQPLNPNPQIIQPVQTPINPVITAPYNPPTLS